MLAPVIDDGIPVMFTLVVDASDKSSDPEIGKTHPIIFILSIEV